MPEQVGKNALGLILSVVAILTQISLVTVPVRAMQVPAGAPSLGGTVVNQKNEPVAGAMVLAQNLSSGMKIPAKTDPKGVYRIPALPPGPFRVTVIMPGYANATVSTVLIANQIGSINFSLTPGCSASPGVPQAPAPPGQTPGAAHPTSPPGAASPESTSQVARSVHVVGCTDLEHSKPSSTIDELQDRSVVNTAQANTALQSPIIRGLDSSRVVTLIDGDRLNSTPVPIPAAALGPSEVQAIRVSPGGNSVAAGSGALGGTVNLFTDKARHTNSGHMLDLEIDGVIRSNGVNRSGAVSLFYSNAWMGLRLGGFLSRQGSYDAGGEGVPIEDVLKFGRFAATLGNSPALFPIWSQPKDFNVHNGASHGSGQSVNLSIYASPKHLFDYSQLNVYTRDIGTVFKSPPTFFTDSFTEFVKIDKYSGRYDSLGLTKWFQKLSIGFYWQKSTIPLAQNNYGIVPGSSFRLSPPGTDPFTGNPSQYRLGSFTENKFSITAFSPNVRVTLAPLKGMVINAGGSLLHELTDDEFISRVFDPTIPVPGPFFPVSDFAYRNSAGFIQVDYNRIGWLHLSGGLRLDNWKSEAQLTSGTTVLGISSTEATRNFSAVFINKHGISPFVRVEKAFREPSIGERVSRGGTGGGNNPFEPESGVDVETGIKVQRKVRNTQFTASAAFFHNHLYNFYTGDSPFRVDGQAANLTVDIERTSAQAQPTPPAPPPLNEVVIWGVDASYQWTIPVLHYGSVTTSGNMNWLHGTNKTPIPAQIALINAVYNRSDTPVRLEGSPDDVPQGLIVPFQGTFGGVYSDARGRWKAEYNLRHSSQITRVNPLILVNFPPNIVSYSTFRNLEPFTLHSLKWSFTKSSEKYRMTFSFGIDNLANRLYWEHFAFAPAAGRSFTFGMALNFADLLRN